MSRPLYKIARDISDDWKKVNFAALPYLAAMFELEFITDFYFQDSAKTVVLYFLGNAQSWRGPVAKAIKTELKGLVS